jgi:hypothetical protein
MLTNLEQIRSPWRKQKRYSPQTICSKSKKKRRRRRRLTIFNIPNFFDDEDINESWSPSNAKKNFAKSLQHLPVTRNRVPKRKFSLTDFEKPPRKKKKKDIH